MHNTLYNDFSRFSSPYILVRVFYTCSVWFEPSEPLGTTPQRKQTLGEGILHVFGVVRLLRTSWNYTSQEFGGFRDTTLAKVSISLCWEVLMLVSHATCFPFAHHHSLQTFFHASCLSVLSWSPSCCLSVLSWSLSCCLSVLSCSKFLPSCSKCLLWNALSCSLRPPLAKVSTTLEISASTFLISLLTSSISLTTFAISCLISS